MLEFNSSDFSKIEGDSIFKLAARSVINESKDDNNSSYYATQYQVLSKDTSFIGVIKQNQKVIGEIKKVAI